MKKSQIVKKIISEKFASKAQQRFFYAMADKDTIVVNHKNIVFTAEPESKLRNQYESITGQVITPPTPQIVT